MVYDFPNFRLTLVIIDIDLVCSGTIKRRLCACFYLRDCFFLCVVSPILTRAEIEEMRGHKVAFWLSGYWVNNWDEVVVWVIYSSLQVMHA